MGTSQSNGLARQIPLGVGGVKWGAAHAAGIGNGGDSRTEFAGGEGVEGAEAVREFGVARGKDGAESRWRSVLLFGNCISGNKRPGSGRNCRRTRRGARRGQGSEPWA